MVMTPFQAQAEESGNPLGPHLEKTGAYPNLYFAKSRCLWVCIFAPSHALLGWEYIAFRLEKGFDDA